MIRLRMRDIGVMVWLLLLLHVTSAYGGIVGSFPADSLLLLRAKRSASACDKEELETMTKSVQATCSDISVIDNHVANVNSKNPISIPSFTDTYGFKNIIHHYNNDLQTAKRNCHSWRNGEKVLDSLADVVAAIQKFESKFSEEFEQNQARLKLIVENYEDISNIETQIAELERDIAEAKKAAILDPSISLLKYFDKIIKKKEEEIKSILKNYDVHGAREELDELIKYLESVKNISTSIEVKSNITRAKINLFRDNIAKDASAFKRHRSHSQAGIAKLIQEKRNGNKEVANIRRDKSNLEKKVAYERAQMADLNRKITQAQHALQNIEYDIARHQRRARERKNLGTWLTLIPVAGWIAGPILISEGHQRLRQLADHRRNFINEHNQQVRNLQSQIERNNRDITQFQNRISSLVTKSNQIERELEYFNNIDRNLLSVQTEVDSLLPTVANTIKGVDLMRNVFDHIRHHLGDITDIAKASKTEAEVRNIKHFIYNEIDALKCKWRQVDEKLLPLRDC